MKYLKLPLTYLLALLIILQCYSLLSMIVPNRYFYLSILLVLGMLILCQKKIKNNQKLLIVAGLYFIGIALLFTSGYFRNMEFLCSVLLPFPLIIIYSMNNENIKRFFEAYTNVMIIISALSLVFFIFGSLLGVINSSGYYPYSQVGWGTNNYTDYYHLYCEGQEVFALGYSGVRNIALFVEGPMLTYTLSFAIYYELFFRNQGYRKLCLGVMIATLITSFSTTGLLIVVLLLYLKFYEAIKKNKIIKILIVPVILIVIGYAAYYIIQDKFINNVYSASARTDDILASFKCFVSDVFNGVGYQNMDAIDPFRTFRRTNAGLSTGFGAILAYGGTLWGIWYMVPFIIALKNYIVNTKSRQIMGFVLMAFALLFLTVVQSRVLCTTINAFCWYFVIQNSISIKKHTNLFV